MRYFEMALIASPDLTSEGQEELVDKIDKLLKKKRKKTEKGEILNINDWGVRKLSYPIKKQSKGHYLFVTVQCCPDTLTELERNLKLSDEVLRFQSLRLDKEPQFETAAAEKPSEEKATEAEKKEAAEVLEAPASEGSSETAQSQQ
ncbi:MAG: 30S ribosomal protein S6 [Proteobacteria bacterium]|nr:30S ribosomal protein S6 [Pseudomonadota bacterium]